MPNAHEITGKQPHVVSLPRVSHHHLNMRTHFQQNPAMNKFQTLFQQLYNKHGCFTQQLVTKSDKYNHWNLNHIFGQQGNKTKIDKLITMPDTKEV